MAVLDIHERRLRRSAEIARFQMETQMEKRFLYGRTIIAPLGWFPRLVHATPKERSNWRLIGRGTGIHWPDVDEDISIAHLLLGQRSSESQRSLQKWLASRTTAKKKKSGS